MEEKEKEKDNQTIGELISDAIDKKFSKMNDIFTNLFIYGPDILNMTIDDIKKYKEDNKNE